MRDRTEEMAKDLYDYGGRLYSKKMVAKFLGISRDAARNLMVGLTPCVGQGTAARYYYRDIAELLAKGA